MTNFIFFDKFYLNYFIFSILFFYLLIYLNQILITLSLVFSHFIFPWRVLFKGLISLVFNDFIFSILVFLSLILNLC